MTAPHTIGSETSMPGLIDGPNSTWHDSYGAVTPAIKPLGKALPRAGVRYEASGVVYLQGRQRAAADVTPVPQEVSTNIKMVVEMPWGQTTTAPSAISPSRHRYFCSFRWSC
ncbi:uncharacterized protein P884DRAFT_130344 [Thermothelomyces heterothallicus CBS 202.75]|uniref:uncharacterized protein n=1 Tax=Thermothelomyces heterothallicus CBS 202.75 TaxID=1149848 RepID=UPI00374359EC